MNLKTDAPLPGGTPPSVANAKQLGLFADYNCTSPAASLNYTLEARGGFNASPGAGAGKHPRPEDAETPTYVLYNKANSEATVLAAYEAKYGHLPPELKCTGGGWLARLERGSV